MLNLSAAKERMLNDHLLARGIENPAVIAAMGAVPREEFVPKHLRFAAYDDNPLPIDEGQTISQPYIVGFMTQALDLAGGERVLEIGTGSGYQAAVLSRIAESVYSVERFGTLARRAAERLAKLGYSNVHVLEGDGTLGWPEHAPYDAVMVTAGSPDVPKALLEQLGKGGRMVIPVGSNLYVQTLVRVHRESSGELFREELCSVRFVPLVGKAGWPQ